MQATRIAKGPPMNGDRGFKERRKPKPSAYNVQLNGRTCLRGTSFAAALIAARGTVEQIQRSLVAIKDEYRRITINDQVANFDLQPGDYTIKVGADTITIKGVQAKQSTDDDALPCGCIDICRSNCDGRSRHW